MPSPVERLEEWCAAEYAEVIEKLANAVNPEETPDE